MIGKRLQDALLVLLLALGIYLWQRTVFPVWTGDVFPNQLGAYYWRHGEYEWIYTPIARFETWETHSLPIVRNLGMDCDLGPFMYPPFVAAILSPFAEFPATSWRGTVFVINFLLLFVFAYQIVVLCGARPSLRALLWALVLVLLCYPMARATKLSQVVPFIAAATWLGLLGMRQGKDWQAGILIGVMGAVKLFPLAVLVLPLLDRRFKVVVVSVVTTIAIYMLSLLMLGWQVHLYWWEVIKEFSTSVLPYFGNQSLLAWLSRAVFGHGGLEEGYIIHPAFFLLRIAIAAVFGCLTALALWKLRGRLISEQLALSCGMVLSAFLLSVPIAWEHYWLFVLPPLGWAIYETVRSRDARFWKVWLAIATFFFLTKLTRFSYTDTLFSRTMSGSQTFGMLLLWIWLLRRAWREKRRMNAVQTA